MIKKLKLLLNLFLIFLKIGLFTFGGGYAMIALIEREFIIRKKWLTQEKFMDMVAIAESTPGPLAINMATYMGYNIGKFAGAVVATVAVCIPSFVIIFVISLFFNAFLQLKLVAYAFKGIQVAVALLIVTAGINMFRRMKKDALNIALSLLTFCLMLSFTLFAVDFSSIFYILMGGAAGLSVFLILRLVGRSRHKRAAESAKQPRGDSGVKRPGQGESSETDGKATGGCDGGIQAVIREKDKTEFQCEEHSVTSRGSSVPPNCSPDAEGEKEIRSQRQRIQRGGAGKRGGKARADKAAHLPNDLKEAMRVESDGQENGKEAALPLSKTEQNGGGTNDLS